MGTIKLDSDELCRNINALDGLKEEINRVLRECSSIGSALNCVNIVSTSRQRRVLQDMQNCLCNFRNGISDLGGDLHDAVRTYDTNNEQINGIINNHKNYNFNYNFGNVSVNNGGVSSNVNNITDRNLKNEGFTESKVTSLFQMSDAEVNNTIAMVGQASGASLKEIDNLACREIENGINTIANDIKVFTYNEPVHIKGAVVTPLSGISSLHNTKVEANVGNCEPALFSNISFLCSRTKIWIKEAFDKVKAKIASLFEAFKEKFSALGNKLLALCKNLGSKVVNAVKYVIKGVKDFVVGVLETVTSAVLSVADLLVTVILSAVKSIGKLFGCNCKGLDNAIASVNNFFYDLAPDKKTFEVCRKIVDFASYLIPYFGVIRTALELISGVDIGSGRYLTLFERLFSIASLFGGKLIAKAGGKIFSKFGKYAGRALDAVDNIGTKVLSKFKTLMPKIASYGDEFAKFISANYNKVSEKFNSLLGGFKSDVKNVFSKAGNLLKRMSESEARFLSKIENAFKNLGQKFTGSLKNVFRNAAGILDDISSKLSPEFVTVGGPSIKGESTFFRDTLDDFICKIEGKAGGSGVVTKTSYVKSIADLKNTENFRDGALEHILEGEINKRGKAVGFHYEGFPSRKGKIIEGSKSVPNKMGVYTGEVEVGGIVKTANQGKSTFFPEEWNSQQVVDAINEAFNNKVFKVGNEFYGYTSNGLKIKMYIDKKTNKIISAFPEY